MAATAAASASGAKLTYPPTRRDETVADDPYRWLEDPDSGETREWALAQKAVTDGELERCGGREACRRRITELQNYPRYSCPWRRGGRYYFFKNDGLQNQSVMYTQAALGAEAAVFLDPNTLSADGTVALGTMAFAESGRYFAYGLSAKGSDWQTVHVKAVDPATGATRDLTDRLEWLKFSSIAWTHDDRGFFYARFPTPKNTGDAGAEVEANVHHKVYYHVLGTPQDADRLVYETPDEPKWLFGVEVTDDGRYLLITVYHGTAPVNRLYYLELATAAAADASTTTAAAAAATTYGYDADKGTAQLVKLVDNFDAEYSYVLNDGTTFYFKTNLRAPKSKVVRVDIAAAAAAKVEPGEWRDVLPEGDDALGSVTCVHGDRLVAIYIHDVIDVVRVFALDGTLQQVLEQPSLGTIVELRGRRHDDEIFYKFTSFLHPGTILRHSFATNRCAVHYETRVPGFDPSHFQTEQVFYASRDGTRIPMFIVARRGMARDASNGVYLYGYGGFSISIQPTFAVSRLVWMGNFGGVLAIANIRGGGEYGEAWHEAGILERKQNVFDDFIAAAEYLIAERYTRPDRLSIHGGSNGGLLVAACVTQRPELFGAAVAQVPVIDMLRYHLFTIGSAWAPDYGTADDGERQRAYLLAYSPLHNVRDDRAPYPALMLATGDHDDRVVPLHSYKFIATVQHVIGPLARQRAPLVIRIDLAAGHGAGKPISKSIEETADLMAFTAHHLGLTWSE